MRRAEEIGSQLGGLYPGGGRQEGREGEQESGSDERAAHEAEGGAAETVRKAEPDRAGAAAKKPTEKRGDQGDGGQDQDEGDDAGEGGRGEQVAEVVGEIGVAPEGHRQADEEPGEVERCTEEAVEGGTHNAIGQQGSQEPVERVEVNDQGWGRFLFGWDAGAIRRRSELPCPGSGRRARR